MACKLMFYEKLLTTDFRAKVLWQVGILHKAKNLHEAKIWRKANNLHKQKSGEG